MNRSIAGPAIMALVFAGIAGTIFLSMETQAQKPPLTISESVQPEASKPTPLQITPTPAPATGFREYPIGDPEGFEKNFIRVAAVWLPTVTMDGGPSSHDSAIHVEADITATEKNPNGFASGEFVPYLKIAYKLTSSDGKTLIDQGTMLPMVARDGLHYGTSMIPPKPGNYKLLYRIEPPSAGGLGRHHDPVTGVAPWWEPFEVTFDWEFDGVPSAEKPTSE